eukprot:TRINITY_DN15345_c0_g1_i1.p1 TRINITY_DN15345_c0_g1~~TRINITY_DN15345_c0_g1_i1.p1  ORF type:complete len:166 (-),score=10.81 TRINITY_DN15345_c0_g1_i1:121-618(-)
MQVEQLPSPAPETVPTSPQTDNRNALNNLFKVATMVVLETLIGDQGILSTLVVNYGARQEQISLALKTSLKHAGTFSPGATESLTKIADYRVCSLLHQERVELQLLLDELHSTILRTQSSQPIFIQMLAQAAKFLKDRYTIDFELPERQWEYDCSSANSMDLVVG